MGGVRGLTEVLLSAGCLMPNHGALYNKRFVILKEIFIVTYTL
jgi:hypothetical protein